MSQSRFSIVLVGVSALLRRPLVSRLRPADGERSPWVVFAARRCLPFRRLPLGGLTLPPSTSGLPLGELAFGLTASAFRHAPLRGCPRRVGSSAFRFGDGRSAGWPSGSRLPLLARTASGLPLGELTFGLTASAFRHAPLRSCRWASWFCRLPFRRLPLGGLAFGLTTSAFRHAPLRGCPRRVGSSAFRFGVAARRVGLRAHGFRFSARTASELPLGELVLPPSVSGLPSASWFFCLPFRRLPLGGLAFGFTASAFRHAPLRGCCSAGWPSGSPLSLFGTHRSASPHRRREGRRSTPTRHLFHFKTLIPTC